MRLPRLSRLFPDAAKNLCAAQSPVARVPVTPSAVFDFRVLCVSGFGSPARFVRSGRSCGMSRWIPSGRKPATTFSVGKTRGALSLPQQPISALQPPVSNSGFGSPVGGPARSSGIPASRKLPRSPETGPPASRTHNPFTIRSCAKTCLQVLCNPQLQIIGLKVSCNQHLQKIPGGRGPALVANAGLNPHFSLRRPDQASQFRGSIFVLSCFDLSRSSAPSQQAAAGSDDARRPRNFRPIRSGRLRTNKVRMGRRQHGMTCPISLERHETRPVRGEDKR